MAKRGASMAACGSMPKTATLRNTCSIDWHCTSPPGVPIGMYGLPFLKTIAGHGVRRGRLPGATALACPSTAHDCEPRVETHEARARHHRRLSAAIARRRREHVAVPIDDAEVRRVEEFGPRSAPAPGGDRARARRAVPDARDRPPAACPDEPCPGRSVAVAPSRTPAESRASHRHVDELGIAVVALAVGERELQRLGQQVHVRGRVEAERRRSSPASSVSAWASTGP